MHSWQYDKLIKFRWRVWSEKKELKKERVEELEGDQCVIKYSIVNYLSTFHPFEWCRLLCCLISFANKLYNEEFFHAGKPFFCPSTHNNHVCVFLWNIMGHQCVFKPYILSRMSFYPLTYHHHRPLRVQIYKLERCHKFLYDKKICIKGSCGVWKKLKFYILCNRFSIKKGYAFLNLLLFKISYLITLEY